jgi:hypothetical protein
VRRIIPRSWRPAALAAAAWAGAAGPARAALLLGSTVTGSLTFNDQPTNYFDAANGYVPAGYDNSAPNPPAVVIAPGVTEFAFQDPDNLVTVDFTDNRLTITDVHAMGSINNFILVLTDAALGGAVDDDGVGRLPRRVERHAHVQPVRSRRRRV